MTYTVRCAFVLLVALVLLTTHGSASNSRPPRNRDISNMADAMKYLQDLDAYYGDKSRTRFGKRFSLAQLLRNRADNAEMAHGVEFPPAEEPF